MSDKRGRRVMFRLFDRAHLYRSSFSNDPHSTSFREGERNVGLYFLATITEACPERYITLLQESRADADQRSGDRNAKR